MKRENCFSWWPDVLIGFASLGSATFISIASSSCAPTALRFCFLNHSAFTAVH
jgi:hypothetical protein